MTELGKAIEKYKDGYPCSSCGSCCKRVDKVVNNIGAFSKFYNMPLTKLKFPYKYDSTGICEMLDENNRCKVYKNRPNVCNIEWMTNHMNVDKDRFYETNIKTCNSLMDEDGVDESFRIVI